MFLLVTLNYADFTAVLIKCLTKNKSYANRTVRLKEIIFSYWDYKKNRLARLPSEVFLMSIELMRIGENWIIALTEHSGIIHKL